MRRITPDQRRLLDILLQVGHLPVALGKDIVLTKGRALVARLRNIHRMFLVKPFPNVFLRRDPTHISMVGKKSQGTSLMTSRFEVVRWFEPWDVGRIVRLEHL